MCHVYYTRGLRFREDGLRLRAAGLIFACKRPYRNGIYTLPANEYRNESIAATVHFGEVRADIHNGADEATLTALVHALKSC